MEKKLSSKRCIEICRFLESILFCFVLLTIFTIKPYAAIGDGDMSPDEGAEEYIQTEEDREKIEEKLAYVEWFYRTHKAEGVHIHLRDDDDLTILVRSVPCNIQLTTWYCGPATVKNVLHHKLGSSLEQWQYSQLLGTTDTGGTNMTNIPAVLNAFLSDTPYVYEQFYAQNSWINRVKASLDTNYPAVLDIMVTNNELSYFQYTTDGHYVAVSGYVYNNTQGYLSHVRIADPHYAYGGTHWLPVNILYQVNYQHWRHALIW